MPRYELSLILKAMQRPETAATLKRTIQALMERGAIVRELENLGERALPYKISKHNMRHTHGGYFLVDFYAPPTIVPDMLDHLSRDIDVIRPTILKQEPKADEAECPGMDPVDLEAKFRRRRK
ncbi:small ribosomal subunit protein bS6m [Rhinophrynus dorsalis]